MLPLNSLQACDTKRRLLMVAQRMPQPQYMTVDEWRELELQSEVKHEYIDGQVYAIAGGTLAHSFIAVNALTRLNRALEEGPCRVYTSDAACRLSPTRYTYPDVVVTCDECDRPTTEEREIQSPRVVIEISSESTERYDRGRKFGYYRACPSVQEYVLISTEYQIVEVFRRTPKVWEYQAYGPRDEVELTSINVCFPVATLYKQTNVPEVLDISQGEI
jgi:Uma2 family endonuclease